MSTANNQTVLATLLACSLSISTLMPANSQIEQQVKRKQEIQRNLQDEQEQGQNTQFQMQQEGFPTTAGQPDSEDMDAGDELVPGIVEQRSGQNRNPAAGDDSQIAVKSNLPITGKDKVLPRFDRIMLSVLESSNIPGGVLTIAKDGKLVLARGYGYAIKERNVPFSPTTRFCLASVTKAITGAAIMHLVDDGKLALDDKLYDVLGRPDLHKIADKRVLDITVRQLLHHSAGWKSDTPGYSQAVLDKVTQGCSVPIEKVILYVMQNQPLDYAPGTECHYSNFQFAVLKCVVDHASGQKYEQYVTEQILKPMGINDVQLEPNKGVYLENEAHRYGPKGHSLPGGRGLPMLTDGMGSLEASALDMIKFLTAIDGTRTKPFLSKKMFDAMLAPPAPPVELPRNGRHFGLGWDTATRNSQGAAYSKGGGVPGVRTYIAHLPNNVDFVFFFNGSGTNKAVTGQTARTLKSALADVRNWPDIDEFTNQ